LRSGARPGDLVYVAGVLGEAVKLDSLAQRRPTPLVDEGLVAARYASAGMDVSDGILLDLGRMLAASKVGAEISDVPSETGEDYALLLAVPVKKAAALERAWKSRAPLRRVGRFTKSRGLKLDGRPVSPRGWDPFR
ncbi:MAG: thiamine-phosphate kinase, partial [Myxococcaceae bacterium]|nr:thiamine-phosphate kinase [Myxococcaceae bacterium]